VDKTLKLTGTSSSLRSSYPDLLELISEEKKHLKLQFGCLGSKFTSLHSEFLKKSYVDSDFNRENVLSLSSSGGYL
jgi:hypothetical protein